MNEKEKVIDWITSGMNYNDGVNLLVELTKKVDIGMYLGRERSMASKLAYEICKAAKVADHVTWKDFIEQAKVVKVETFTLPSEHEEWILALLHENIDEIHIEVALIFIDKLELKPVSENLEDLKICLNEFLAGLTVETEGKENELTNDGSGTKLPEAVAGEEDKLRIGEADGEAMQGRNFSEVKETIATKPLEEYPLVMRRVIMEYAELFQERSQLHTVMGRLPESNTESVCAKRAELFNLIKSISDRLELLFVTQEAFAEAGIIPVESELFPPAAEPVVEVTADTTLVDEDSLKKQKKNLQSGNSKDQTILEYQSNDRTDVKKPMPNGPKRTKIEMRIAERNTRIEEIEVLLLKYVGKE
ncbi:MAG TPA: hypothetical protein VFC67_14830 [Prolixibacteraceae bacterium]|nr:hypothetical protein [Prolixibacteraceae bacterium]